MFSIKTKDKIINFQKFEGVRIVEFAGEYALCVFNDYVEGQQPREILLAKYKTKGDAIRALNDLYDAIVRPDRPPGWHAE